MSHSGPPIVFYPVKFTGLVVGLSGIVLLAALELLLLLVVREAPPSLGSLAAFCLFLVTLPLVAWLVECCSALARARYVLSRNALVVDWGNRREVIPMQSISEMCLGEDFEEDEIRLRPRNFSWPGYVVGWSQEPGIGGVEYLGTTDKFGLVMVRYPRGWLAISPPDPQAFLSAYAERRIEGITETVEAESIRPGGLQLLAQDRLAVALIGLGGVSMLALAVFLLAVYRRLPETIILHFDSLGQPDRWGPPANLFILPFIGGLTWVWNSLLGFWLYRRQSMRTGAYLLFGATLFVQVLVWVAALGLVSVAGGG